MSKNYHQYLSERSPALGSGKFLHFEGIVENKDVYNITPPFIHKGKLTLAGRVEARKDIKSTIVFFTH